MWLGCDKALPFEDPPNGRDRWQLGELSRQVMVDGLRPGVIAGGLKLASELDDQVLGLGVDLVGAGHRSTRPRL